jgi:hypothetical protein
MSRAPARGAPAPVLASSEGAVRVVAAAFRFLLVVRHLRVSRAQAVPLPCLDSLSYVFLVLPIVIALCYLFPLNEALIVCGYFTCCASSPP